MGKTYNKRFQTFRKASRKVKVMYNEMDFPHLFSLHEQMSYNKQEK